MENNPSLHQGVPTLCCDFSFAFKPTLTSAKVVIKTLYEALYEYLCFICFSEKDEQHNRPKTRHPRVHLISDTANNQVPCVTTEDTAAHKRWETPPVRLITTPLLSTVIYSYSVCFEWHLVAERTAVEIVGKSWPLDDMHWGDMLMFDMCRERGGPWRYNPGSEAGEGDSKCSGQQGERTRQEETVKRGVQSYGQQVHSEDEERPDVCTGGPGERQAAAAWWTAAAQELCRQAKGYGTGLIYHCLTLFLALSCLSSQSVSLSPSPLFLILSSLPLSFYIFLALLSLSLLPLPLNPFSPPLIVTVIFHRCPGHAAVWRVCVPAGERPEICLCLSGRWLVKTRNM